MSVFIGLVGVLGIGTVGQASLAGMKDSSQFSYKYEANTSTPEIEDTASGWVAGGNATASVSDGVLHYSSSEEQSLYYNAMTFVNNATAATSYTMEVRVKILSSSGDYPGLAITPAGNGKIAWLSIASDNLQWEQDGVVNDVFATGDNASDFHVFRMAYDASESTYLYYL
jgi:hydroxymethylpyrimidine pyrophosphatase-like HAD family hydrolase